MGRVFVVFGVTEGSMQLLRHDFGEAEDGVQRRAHVVAEAVKTVFAGVSLANDREVGGAGIGEGWGGEQIELTGVGCDFRSCGPPTGSSAGARRPGAALLRFGREMIEPLPEPVGLGI